MELLVITYHYIGDEHAYKKGIYPVLPERLGRQIDDIRKKYTIVSEHDLLAALDGEKKLPTYSCILTFDDGLKDHYTNAYPVLKRKKAPALFFVPTKHLTEKVGYTIHKIHYLLSQIAPDILLKEVEHMYSAKVGSPVDWSALDLVKIYAWYMYDDKDSAKFKFLLNHHLDGETTDTIVNALFINHYSGKDSDFCDMFYLNLEEIKELKGNDLISLGLHTHTHVNIPREKKEIVEEDIRTNFNFLKKEVGAEVRGMSYPFGLMTKELYQEKISHIAKELGLAYAFSTEKTVNCDLENSFLLGRFNPNEIDTLLK